LSDDVSQIFKAEEEVGWFFDESSLSYGAQPNFVLIFGPVAVGKTTLRKEKYATGFVLIDAVPIFLHMSRGEYYSFSTDLCEPMDVFGRMIATRAIQERRHIVTEMIGGDEEAVQALIDAMTAIGYKVDLIFVHCPLEQAVQWNLNRRDDSISAYYAEPFQWTWMMEAASASASPDREDSIAWLGKAKPAP